MNKTYAELKESGTVYLTVPIKIELEKRIRVKAAELGLNKAELSRRAIEQYLEGLESENQIND